MTKEDIEQIRAMMKEEIKPINNRLDKIDDQLDEIREDISDIKESLEEVRGTTNACAQWINENFKDEYPFPVELKNKI